MNSITLNFMLGFSRIYDVAININGTLLFSNFMLSSTGCILKVKGQVSYLNVIIALCILFSSQRIYSMIVEGKLPELIF